MAKNQIVRVADATLTFEGPTEVVGPAKIDVDYESSNEEKIVYVRIVVKESSVTLALTDQERLAFAEALEGAVR